MSKLAYICPGQASQVVGMGSDLYEAFPEVAERFQQADEIMQAPLSQICFAGPEEMLRQTRYTQPALFVHSAVVAMLLAKRGIQADMVAGHSLGEYSALFAAGALDFESALRVVKVRGEGMQHAGEVNPGTMAAIVGLEEEQVRTICKEAAKVGVVQPANFNSPGQVAISGDITGVQKAVELAKAAGAKIAKELIVSGAFHSPLMTPAQDSLWAVLDALEIKPPRCPVYANVTASPTSSPVEIRQLLKEQLLAPVLWMQSVQAMIRDGGKIFLEIGPGNVLTGLIKRIDRNVNCIPV
ncbi:MAG: ACP S-malonyltransferase, partial [bacterium]